MTFNLSKSSVDSPLVINNWANFYDETELESYARQFNDIVYQVQVDQMINGQNEMKEKTQSMNISQILRIHFKGIGSESYYS